MDRRSADVVIIGGGASGLAAAVELGMSSPDLSVLVIEKMKEPGRKIRATGSGRCNITNTKAAGYDRIMEFFTRIGLSTVTYENGLVYPHSESAADVAELLIARARMLGVKFSCGDEVIALRRTGDEEGAVRFEIESKYKDGKGEHRVVTKADYVILACGGKAAPNFGTTGDGYSFARELGHSIVTPVPVLTGIECAEWDEHAEPRAIGMAGTRTTAMASLYKIENGILPTYIGYFFTGEYKNMRPIATELGEVQFTKYGLSGICIFNLTRYMRYDKSAGESLDDFFIILDLFPHGAIAEVVDGLMTGEFAEMPAEEMLRTVVKKDIAEYLMDLITVFAEPGIGGACESGIKDKPVSELNIDEVRILTELVHGLEFRPKGLRGWKDAQATSGGVSLSEIDEQSSESNIVSGLYITGELADRDYPCGGFNLSNAWLTGLNAADDIASKG